MSDTTADLIRLARKEAFIEAAAIAGKVGDRIMREADKAHRNECYDAYESLESLAIVASEIERKLLNKAKRDTSVTRPAPQSTGEVNDERGR